MNDLFPADRDFALNRLNEFVSSGALSRYAATRNTDFGPENRDNTSCLSPYIRHGLLSEEEVLSAVLKDHSYASVEKYIQEVFWRNYWKGWLQMRPSIWSDYKHSLELLDKSGLNYQHAIAGRTGISCFDFWIQELLETGYLHNHARMWFASIWIFTLKLPWALGAEFFYRHLLDGDAACNTLSWRWVAGMQTVGKTYLARPDNIEKFTNSRFRPDGLALDAPAIDGPSIVEPQNLELSMDCQKNLTNACIIITEDDVRAPHLPERYPYRFLPVEKGSISSKVLSFKNSVINDYFNNDFETVIVSHPPVGYANDCLCQLEKEGLRVIRVVREYDRLCWPHSRKGFFPFKKHIPEILDKLNLLKEV